MLIALQFHDCCVYEHALHLKNLQFSTLYIDMFCKIPTTYTYYLVQKVLTDWGTRWRSWLRHCAISRKVAGSIPGGAIGFFSLT